MYWCNVTWSSTDHKTHTNHERFLLEQCELRRIERWDRDDLEVESLIPKLHTFFELQRFPIEDDVVLRR